MSQEKNQNEKLETVVYKPKTKEKKNISLIWILPLIVLSILGWIGYESYIKKGTNISVVFKSADGLKVGVTPLEYRGLQLGKVTKIEINDLNSVKVNILVNSDVAKYVATQGSSFWIKKPTITLTKVSGLGTILSGNKIEMYPKFRSLKEYENAKPKYEFEGLDTKPSLELNGDGYYVSILSTKADLVEVETPIFYNRFQIGEIVSKEFKDENVYLKAYIYNRYNDLVNESSQFYMNKALKASFGPTGLSLEVSSLYSALVGGITVQTPNKEAKKMPKDEFYVLFEDKNELIEKTYINLKFEAANGIAKDSAIMYKGMEVGKVQELHLTEHAIIAKAYLIKQYEYLLTNNSKFNLEEVEVGLDGVKNLSTVVSGNYLSIDYQKGEPKYFFNIKNSKIEKSSKDLIITLKAQNLNSISRDSKLYFKNIAIGQVLDYTLSKDFKEVEISVLVEEKYKNLINDKTLFYDMSSKLVELNNLDLDINYSGFKPLINGGISLINISEKAKFSNKDFKLYNSYKQVEQLKKQTTSGFNLTAYFDNSFEIKKDQTINYKNQEIGFVKSINFDDKKSKVKLFIYNKYKKYITKNSRFYKKSAIKLDASLSGLLFEVDNISALLNGSIELDNSSTKSIKEYEIYSSYDSMKNASNTILIVFDDVEGLKSEFSKLTYKGVAVGKVTQISLSSKNKVFVKVQIFKNFEKFAKKGNSFYLKKPKISLTEIKNIGSTIMPVEIGVVTSLQKGFKNSFNGFDSLEDINNIDDGIVLKVESLSPTNINEDAPIYYKNVQIGKVNKINLAFDGTTTLLECLIYDKYKHLVRSNSTFHDISGLKLKFSLFSGTKIEANTFTSILKGGLMVITPYEYNEVASSQDRFILHKKLMEGWESINPSIKLYD